MFKEFVDNIISGIMLVAGMLIFPFFIIFISPAIIFTKLVDIPFENNGWRIVFGFSLGFWIIVYFLIKEILTPNVF